MVLVDNINRNCWTAIFDPMVVYNPVVYVTRHRDRGLHEKAMFPIGLACAGFFSGLPIPDGL